ncbi:autotransporter outer membrane beta-barrel domain-containing protein [Roseibium sp.]|uniref:autotransporter outer membrane beta-barrel domain-containing protein n=1 Tax=Roseibium sp. TaxID=1936156 RepID=UPI003A97A0C5
MSFSFVRPALAGVKGLLAFSLLISAPGVIGTKGAQAASFINGCSAIAAGSLNFSVTDSTDQRNISNLNDGDVVTLNITDPSASAGLVATVQVTLDPSGANTKQNTNIPNGTTQTITVTVSGYSAMRVSLGAEKTGRTLNLTASCTEASTDTSDSDSDKITKTQAGRTAAIMTQSGSAISGAANNGANAAFDGGTPFNADGGGITLNFAPDMAARLRAKKAREAFSALGFADSGTPATFVDRRTWNAWVNVRGGWLVGNSSDDGMQLNATAGIGYLLTPNFVAGVIGGVETFDYSYGSTSSSLSGTGGTVGVYGGWKVLPAMRVNGLVSWTGIDYETASGAANGKIDGSRFLGSFALSGQHEVGPFRITPNASVMLAHERQGSYTDSASTFHNGMDILTGMTSIGGRVSKAIALFDSRVTFTPYVGGHADWQFSDINSSAVTSSNPASLDGWSARVSGGFSLIGENGCAIQIGAELGGLGAQTQELSANGRVSLSF